MPRRRETKKYDYYVETEKGNGKRKYVEKIQYTSTKLNDEKMINKKIKGSSRENFSLNSDKQETEDINRNVS